MIIAVDVDDTVSQGGPFWVENPIPIQENLDKVNELYMKGHTIIYHTARHPRYYEQTYGWLVHHGAYFHALEMGKLTADVYLDDRACNVEDIDSLFED